MNPFPSKWILLAAFLLASFSMPVSADTARHCVGSCDDLPVAPTPGLGGGNYYETYHVSPSDAAETSSDAAYVTKAEYLSTSTSESKSSNIPATYTSRKR